MGTKRMIKLLMAEGVQRNEAAAFVKTYHKVQKKPVIKLFPELIVPRPVVRCTQTIQPITYAVQYVAHKQYFIYGKIDHERYVRKILMEKLMNGLANGGGILWEHKEYPSEVIFTAKLRVLPFVEGKCYEPVGFYDVAFPRRLSALSPEEKELYTLGNWGSDLSPTK